MGRFVIMNFGTFTQPKLPGVSGVESFKGNLFHTSRWDYDYVRMRLLVPQPISAEGKADAVDGCS